MSEKLSKAAVLYIHIKGTRYQCKDCAAFLPKEDGCAFHLRSEFIRPYGECGLFLLGKPETYTKRPHHPLLKVESGYFEQKEGSSCNDCEYFAKQFRNCAKVERDSPGDDPGEIHPDACCNNYEHE